MSDDLVKDDTYLGGDIKVGHLYLAQEALSDDLEVLYERFEEMFVVQVSRLIETYNRQKDLKALPPDQRVEIAALLLEGTSSKVAPR